MSTMLVSIAENGTALNKYSRTAYLTAYVYEESKRKEVTEAINNCITNNGLEPEKRIIKWRKVSPKEQQIYTDILDVALEDGTRFFQIAVPKFNYKKLNWAYVQLIQAIRKEYPDDFLRIQVAKKDYLKYNYVFVLKNRLDDRKCYVEQVDTMESRDIQMADLVGGLTLYFKRDDQYLEKMGSPGKPEVVDYWLTARKPKDKISEVNYKEEQQ